MNSRARRILASLVLVLTASVTASALSPAEYQKRLDAAAAAIESLLQDQYASEEEQMRSETATLSAVRESLSGIRVEWEYAPVEVSNGWLGEAIQRFQAAGQDTAARHRVLGEIALRLRALSSQLGQNPVASHALSKAEAKARLDSILKRSEYRAEAGENALLKYLRRFLLWLWSLFPERGPLRPGSLDWVTAITQYAVLGLALATLIYCIWRFGPRAYRRFVSSRRTKERGARVILGERLGPEQSSADLLREAEALALGGEFRSAIRKGYIALLCELADRNVIAIATHRTNHDYLQAVREHGRLHSEMKALTSSFETHWYGFAPACDADWASFRQGYSQALGAV